MKKYKFPQELEEGIIIARPNRFIMLVRLGTRTVECHCPVTGRIGSLVFDQVPCLLSKADNPQRRTRYTVEAISLDKATKKNKKWIGINQNKINRYVEFFLSTGQLSKITGPVKELRREVGWANSRLDFLVNNIFLEVKMPLIALLGTKAQASYSNFNSFERLIRHFQDLGKNSRAIVLLCYLYPAPSFVPPKINRKNDQVKKAAQGAVAQGMEMWQANFAINSKEVALKEYFRLKSL